MNENAHSDFGLEMEKRDLVNKNESWFEVGFPRIELMFLC